MGTRLVGLGAALLLGACSQTVEIDATGGSIAEAETAVAETAVAETAEAADTTETTDLGSVSTVPGTASAEPGAVSPEEPPGDPTLEPPVAPPEGPGASSTTSVAESDPIDDSAPGGLAYHAGLLSTVVPTAVDLDVAGLGHGWYYDGIETRPEDAARPGETVCGLAAPAVPEHQQARWTLGAYEVMVVLSPSSPGLVELVAAYASGCPLEPEYSGRPTEIDGADLAVNIELPQESVGSMAVVGETIVWVSVAGGYRDPLEDGVDRASPEPMPTFRGGSPTTEMVETLTALVVERLRG